MSEFMIGMDIGGTSVKFGIVSVNGDLIHKWSIPTRTEENGSFILPDSWDSIKVKLKYSGIQLNQLLGIGVGVPGFIDSHSGLVYEAVNIGWKNKQIKQQLTEISSLPVFLENDANIAVLGENWRGAGNGSSHVIAVTLGTGVGGGIISNGKILNGINGMAGELGHILIEEDGAQCNCGNRGCLETIASATGIARQAMEIIHAHPESSLADYYKRKKRITAKDIFQMAEQGDTLADKIIERVSDALGLTFANLGVILNPERILIGGGVSQAGQTLINRINLSFNEYALPRISAACEIKLAELGNDAGIIGAAYLVKQNKNSL